MIETENKSQQKVEENPLKTKEKEIQVQQPLLMEKKKTSHYRREKRKQLRKHSPGSAGNNRRPPQGHSALSET